MSINAIDPRQGHTQGNMRIICNFLNTTNFDKLKKRSDADDGPTAWTRELYAQYINFDADDGAMENTIWFTNDDGFDSKIKK